MTSRLRKLPGARPEKLPCHPGGLWRQLVLLPRHQDRSASAPRHQVYLAVPGPVLLPPGTSTALCRSTTTSSSVTTDSGASHQAQHAVCARALGWTTKERFVIHLVLLRFPDPLPQVLCHPPVSMSEAVTSGTYCLHTCHGHPKVRSPGSRPDSLVQPFLVLTYVGRLWRPAHRSLAQQCPAICSALPYSGPH